MAEIPEEMRQIARQVSRERGISWTNYTLELLLEGVLPAHEATVRAKVAAEMQPLESVYPDDYHDSADAAGCESCVAKTDAVMAIRDEEMERLREELAEARSKLDRVIQGRTQAQLDRNAQRQRAEKAETELERLRTEETAHG